jgi:hypothetical protein
MMASCRPLCRRDFAILFVTRFLTQTGIATVQEFLSFFISDAILERPYVLHGVNVAQSPEEAVSVLFAPMLIGAFIASGSTA